MCCRTTDLRNKQVICIKDGCTLGFVCDVEVDTCSGQVVSLIVPGRLKFLGLFGREDDIIVEWKDIEVIGDDTILVNCTPSFPVRRFKNKFFGH